MSEFQWHAHDIDSRHHTAWSLPNNHMGPGQVETADGKRGHNIFRILGPVEVGDGSNTGIPTLFDKTTSPFTMDTLVKGPDVLLGKLNRYTQPHELVPELHGAYFEAGQDSTAGSNRSGRTGWHMSRKMLHHNGNGDAGCENWNLFMSNGGDHMQGTVPAGILANGQITAGAPNVYFNPFEFNHKDNGHAVRSNGWVNNYYRTSDADPNGYWDGNRQQSKGSVACDSAFVPVGYWRWGYDSTAGEGATHSSYKAGDRLYLDCGPVKADEGTKMYGEALSETYIGYEDNAIQMVVDGVAALSVHASGISLNGKPVSIERQPAIANTSGQLEVMAATINKMLQAMRAAGVIDE